MRLNFFARHGASAHYLPLLAFHNYFASGAKLGMKRHVGDINIAVSLQIRHLAEGGADIFLGAYLGAIHTVHATRNVNVSPFDFRTVYYTGYVYVTRCLNLEPRRNVAFHLDAAREIYISRGDTDTVEYQMRIDAYKPSRIDYLSVQGRHQFVFADNLRIFTLRQRNGTTVACGHTVAVNIFPRRSPRLRYTNRQHVILFRQNEKIQIFVINAIILNDNGTPLDPQLKTTFDSSVLPVHRRIALGTYERA